MADRGLFAQGRLVAVLAFGLLAYGGLKDNYQVLLGASDVEVAKLGAGMLGEYVAITCDEVVDLRDVRQGGRVSGHIFACKRGDRELAIYAPKDTELGKQVEGTLHVLADAEVAWPEEVRTHTTMYLDVKSHTKALVLAIFGCLSALVAIGLGVFFVHQQTKQAA